MSLPPEETNPRKTSSYTQSLRGRLIRHFLLVLAIPALSLPLLTLNFLYHNKLESKREDSLELAVRHNRYVENLLETRAIEVLLVSQFPEARRLINAVSDADRAEALEALTQRVQAYFVKHADRVVRFRIIDVQGREWLNLRADADSNETQASSVIDYSDKDYFVGAMHLAAIRGRNLPVNVSQEHPLAPLSYSSLVMDDNGIIAGVIVLETGLDQIWREINEDGPGKLSELYDANGVCLLRENPGHICIPFPQEQVAHMLRHEKGVLPDGGFFPSSFRVFSRIQPPGQSTIRWTALYEIPLVALDAPFQTAVKMVACITLAAVLISLVLAWAFSREITRPLSQLATAAGDLCRGYWDTLLPNVPYDDEIAGLTRGFASMSRQLRGAQESLIAKVKALGESEIQLAQEKERLSVTLRSIGDAVIATDTGGSLLFANPAAEKLLEIHADHPGKLTFPRMSDPLTGEVISDLLPSALRGESVGATRDVRLRTSSGEDYLLETSAAAIRNPRSEIVGSVIVLRNVTRARRLAEEQHRLEKLESLGILAGGIAHDFNNLVSVVMGDLSLLSARMPGDEPDREIIENAMRATRRARGLTQQLLTFAKGGSPVKRSASLLELVEESARFAMHGSNSSFHLEAPATLWNAEVDPGQMHQVFHNLSLNAVQAMPNGGVLSIRLENVRMAAGEHSALPEGTYVQIRFRDQGVGIAPQLLSRIFDPYFTTKERGNGLGLSSVHSIVTAHQGHISVNSSTPQGTEFTLLIPACESLSSPNPSEPNLPLHSTEIRKYRVLLLDDERGIHDTTRRLLQHLGHRSECVLRGEEAIQAYRVARESNDPFQICILDLTIPGGMGGRETLERLREIDPSVRAIVTSGYSQDEVLARYREFGFHAVLQKPFSLHELQDVIAAALSDD